MAKADIAVDWRSTCCSFVEQWGEIRRRNFHTDVEFIVDEGDLAKRFSAHKLVLATCSSVFEAMFYGQVPEKKSSIPIVDCEPEVFELLLRSVYGQDIDFTSIAIAAKTYAIADKYLVFRLKATAEKYISRAKINDSQFWDMIQNEHFLLVPIIRKICLDYLSKHAKPLLQSDLMLSISEDIMNDILQMDYINISEYELLLATARWIKKSSTLKTKLVGRVASFLFYIRFSNISREEFINFDENMPGFLDPEDSLAILKYLCNPTSLKLPHWCSTLTQIRNSPFTSVEQKNISPLFPIALPTCYPRSSKAFRAE